MTKQEKIQRLEGFINDYENADKLDVQGLILFGKCSGYIVCLFDNGDLTVNEFIAYNRRI